MRLFRPVIAVTFLMLWAFTAPLAAQSLTADLTDLLLRNASPPFFTSAPVPSGAAFCAVSPEVFDNTNPRALSLARIDRFPLGAGRSVSLNLRRMDVMAPTGIAVAGTTAGDMPFELEKHLIFSGSVENVPGSFVYLAVFRRYCAGYVEMPGPDGTSQRYIIAPDNVSGIGQATMVIYDAQLLPFAQRPHTECSAEMLPDYQQRVESVFRKIEMSDVHKVDGTARKLLAPATLAVQIAVECDIRYYKAHSSNLSQSANYALIVLGASSAIYQRDVNVALQIPYLRIWTTTGPYTGPVINDLLGQIRNYWNTNMGPVKRSTALMFSHNIGGGLAWVGVLCGDYGYAVAGLGNNINYPAESYVWDVDVTSHELGHNFGSAHTHNCSWAPPIDSCVEPEGGCTKETNPHTGSVMSYCHLNAGTHLYFHPRVATHIRKNFENTSCVGPVESTLANDMAVVSITVPALGGKVARGATFVPSVIVRNLGTSTQTNLTVTYTIDSSTTIGDGTRLYTNTQTVAALAAGSSVTVAFLPTSIATNGVYQARAAIGPDEDLKPINNTMVRPFEVVNPSGATSLTVTSPNGGETYAAGSTIDITWTASGVETITVQFSTDNGISWSPVRYNRSASQGTVAWTVPAIPTTQGRIMINNVNDAGVNDISDGTFTITMQKDVQAIDFINPGIEGTIATPTTPRVEFRNNGLQTVTNVPVRLSMYWRGDGSEVYRHTVTIPQIAPGAVQAVDFPATPLLPLGTHVMIARAMLEGDEYPSNDSIGRTCNLDGVSPPIGVRANPMSRAVLLTWSPSPAAKETGYRIYRGTSPDNMTLIASLRPSVLAYADEPLVDGTEYFYGISSTEDTRLSVYSRLLAVTPMTYPAGFTLGAPDLILPDDNASGVTVPVRLLWGTLEGGVIYQLQIATDEAMTDVLLNRFTRDPQNEIPATFGTTYYWRVRAFNYSSIGQWSPARRFVTGNGCGVGALALDGVAGRMKRESFAWSDTAVTVEFWNYVRSADVKNASVFSVGKEATGNRFQAHVPWSDKTLHWDYGEIGADGRISTDYTRYLDKWTHVALVSNGRNFKGIYLDGVLVASGDKAAFPSSRTELVLGCFVSDNYHKGRIDEFRIWKKVRTQEEITRDMRRRLNGPQEGLAGYWRFDEGSGRSASDQSGNGNHGELNSDSLWASSDAPVNCDNPVPLVQPQPASPADGASFTALFAPTFTWNAVPGATAYHLQLAVSEDFKTTERDIPNIAAGSRMVPGLRPDTRYFWRVRAANAFGIGEWSDIKSFTTAATCAASALSFNGSGGVVVDSYALNGRAVTVEFWNYIDSAGVKTGSAFSVGRSDDQENRLQSHAPWTDRNLYWDYGNMRTTGRLTTGYGPYLGRWTHVALVSNGLDQKAIYLNGEPVATAGTADMPHDLARLVIGGIPGSWYHNGMIDEFRIWNTPRTREEIKQDMYRKLMPPQSGLVGYWSMDEGDGMQVHDSSGFAHDGVMQPADPLWKTDAVIPMAPVAEPVSGPVICAAGSAENIYGVDPTDGAQYGWTVTGGTIVAGAGSPSIIVQWDDRDADGVISLRRDYTGGCADSVYLGVRVGKGADVEGGSAVTGLSFTSAPEPFSSSTLIRYRLARREQVRLEVYTMDGALVRRLVDGAQDPGDHQIMFNGEGLAAGIYICRLGAGDRYLYVKALHLVR